MAETAFQSFGISPTADMEGSLGLPGNRWGDISHAGLLTHGCPAALVLGAAGTIPTTSYTQPVNPGGAVAGIILAPGTVPGQDVVVINESAFTVTFDVVGTSNVADGVSDVIAALTARKFIWDANVSRWFHQA
jgi:hypothetical protein